MTYRSRVLSILFTRDLEAVGDVVGDDDTFLLLVVGETGALLVSDDVELLVAVGDFA